jgi:hypothetical protein
MSEKKDMRTVALEILERLETEGIGGVWVRFTETPHMGIYESVVGYTALYWRDGVRVVVELDDEFRARKAYVHYQD